MKSGAKLQQRVENELGMRLECFYKQRTTKSYRGVSVCLLLLPLLLLGVMSLPDGFARTSTGRISLPIEVLGVDGATLSRTVTLEAGDAESAKSLWLRVHGVRYANQGSVQVNSSAWIPLSNETAAVTEPGKSFGGIGGGFATLTILTKNSLMENMSQDYVRTAFAKGLHKRRVIFVHALRNSLIPIVTGLGQVFSLVLAGSFLIEKVFNIDGMGYLGYTSILQRDYPVALGILVVSSLLMLIGNIISDIIYAAVDPRIRFR